MAKKFLTGIDVTGNKIINVADPTAATDGVNKRYVDDLARSFRRLAPVKAATVAALAATGLGAALIVDGVSLLDGDSVLRKNQTPASDNGIFVYTSSGGGTLARRADADTNGELADGSTVFVQQGTVNGDKQFTQTTNDDTAVAPSTTPNAINIGTTLQVWVQTGGGGNYTAGAGIIITGNTISVDPNATLRKLSATIGNGTATQFDLTHNWGTQAVQVALRDTATNTLDEADFIALDNNTVRVIFAAAPATNSYQLTAFG